MATRGTASRCLRDVSPPVAAQSKPFHLSGVIADLEGAPIEDVRVELVDAVTHHSASVSTDRSGRYELRVPAGRYRTRLTYGELEMSSEDDVAVTAGTDMTLDVELHVTRRARAPFCFSAACVDRLPGIDAPGGGSR